MIIKITYKARKLLADNIAFYREEKNWTQEQLAEKLETTVRHLSNIENAKLNSGIDFVERISNVLNIEIYQLFEKRDNYKHKRIRK